MTLTPPPNRPVSAARRRLGRALLALPTLALAPAARAVTLNGDPVPHMWHSFNEPDNGFLGKTSTRWQNTDPGALYAEWGGFIPDPGNPRGWTFSTPTVGLSPLTSAVLQETSGTGLLTGIGNIYGLAYGQVPGPPLVFELLLGDRSGSDPGVGRTRTVVMRSGTKGVLPEMTVLLNGVPAIGVNTFREDGSIDMPTGPGGAMEPNVTTDGEWIWVWTDVPAVRDYRFDFRATVGHMSLDNLAVYASPPVDVPVLPPTAIERRHPRVRSNALASGLGETLADRISP